jgi:hypothetical protein
MSLSSVIEALRDLTIVARHRHVLGLRRRTAVRS